MAKITVKHDDKQVGFIEDTSYEVGDKNIAIHYYEDIGFQVSVLDRKTNIMNFYKDVDGKLVIESRENIMTGDELMLRDDIRDSLFELLKANFIWITHVKLYEKHELKKDLTIIQADLNEFAGYIENQFDLEFISPDAVSKWTTIKDIVNYIENALECALHDME